MKQIYNFETPEELFGFMNEKIKYGYVDTKGVMHLDKVPKFNDEYKVNVPEVTVEKECGLCIDQVEVEKEYFKNKNIPFKEYLIGALKNSTLRFHVLLIYEENGEFCWFENSYDEYNGIKKYKDLNECFKDVKDAFFKREGLSLEDEKSLLLADVTEITRPGLDQKEWIYLQKELKNIKNEYRM